MSVRVIAVLAAVAMFAASCNGFPQCPELKQGLCCPGAKELSICNRAPSGRAYYCQNGLCVKCGLFSQNYGVCCPHGPPQAPCALPGGSGALFPGFCRAPPPSSPPDAFPTCVLCGEQAEPCCPSATAGSKCGTRSVGFCKGSGSGTALRCTACGGANEFPAKQPCCPAGLYAGYTPGGCAPGKQCKAGFCV